MVALEPNVLLLDEPTSGVAQSETEALGDLLLSIKKHLRTTLLVVEHDIALIMRISDRILAMAAGEVIAVGAPDVIRADPRVIESYLGVDGPAASASTRGRPMVWPCRRRAEPDDRVACGTIVVVPVHAEPASPAGWTWSRLRLTLGVVVLACAGVQFQRRLARPGPGNRNPNPTDSETVHQPFTVRWTGTPKAAEYAVFFDRTPMRPGGNLKSLVKRNDPLQSALNAANGQTVTPESCEQDPACPPLSWLNAHGVYVTTS